MSEDKKNITINSKRLFAKAMGEDISIYEDKETKDSHKPPQSHKATEKLSDTKEAQKLTEQEKGSTPTNAAHVDEINTEKITSSSANQSTQHNKRSRKKVLLWWLLVLLFIILLIAAFKLGMHWQDTNSGQVVSDTNNNNTEVVSTTEIKKQMSEPIVATDDTITQTSNEKTITIIDTINIVDSAQHTNDISTNATAIQEETIDEALPIKLPLSFFEEERLFVSCFAMKKEEDVLKKIAYIKSKGYEHVYYYWIPEVQPDGNRFYKIVVGPFTSTTEAQKALTGLQHTINQEAYLLRVKQL